jgi:hypothetical protein
MSDKSRDLSELAAGAHLETERQLKPQPRRKPLLGAKSRSILAACLAAGGIIATYGFAGPYFLGYSDHTLRKELTAVVAAARDDIESARKQKGALPGEIANMALSMVVEYHRNGDGYRLVANDGVRVIEMDDKGNVSESKIAR